MFELNFDFFLGGRFGRSQNFLWTGYSWGNGQGWAHVSTTVTILTAVAFKQVKVTVVGILKFSQMSILGFEKSLVWMSVTQNRQFEINLKSERPFLRLFRFTGLLSNRLQSSKNWFQTHLTTRFLSIHTGRGQGTFCMCQHEDDPNKKYT
jgi:hypothetical protein